MSYPFNEYSLIRALKKYFAYMRDNESVFAKIYTTLFESIDVPQTDQDAFKDIIVNGKIDLKVSFTNTNSELPTVICVMDQEVQRMNPVGDYVGETQDGAEYGYFVTGVYSITVYTQSLLLTRLFSLFIKVCLEHYFNNDTDNNIVEFNINVDRFTPHIDYLPTDVFYFKLTLRCEYLETYQELYDDLAGIILCGIKIDEKADGTIEEIIPFEVDLSLET